jgi:chloride channel protein, CIC family
VLYLGLGILSAVVAVASIKTFYFTRDRIQNWQAPEWGKPTGAGVLVGVMGIFLPRVLGVGYGSVGDVLTGHLADAVPVLLALIVVKMIATNLSVGSGFMGGAFAPALFLGAMLGQAYGLAMQSIFPGSVAAPAAYAMVGMAAVLAGSVHAPLTSILLLFEMTRDYRIILPLMLAVGVALLISEHWQKDGFYTLSLRRHGLHLERGRDVDVMQGVAVGQAMTLKIDRVLPSMKAEALIKWFAATRHHGAPVIDEQERLIGMVTLHDIDLAQEKRSIDQLTVLDLCSRDLTVAYADESLWVALKRLGTHDIGRLPVVSRDAPKKLIGLVRRQDIIKAYNTAIMEKMALRYKIDQVKLSQLTGTNILEVKIPMNSPVSNRTIAEVKWPSDCVVTSIRRGRKVLIPRGNTQLMADDVVVIVTPDEATQAIKQLVLVGANGQE